MARPRLETTEAVSRRMRRTGPRDTSPERAVRSILFARGYRYRVDRRPIREIRSRADLVFLGMRVAVYIDGCFWHGCPLHATHPQRNAHYWEPKLRENRSRDLRVTERLTEAGWVVLRYWEHEPAEEIADAIGVELEKRRAELAAQAHLGEASNLS
ncbi:MAG: very short patch repair endonuclease [Isosphaeraceae bacterium]|nr:very short patch repair endonuclease [Isosphaeraceae bacterium]